MGHLGDASAQLSRNIRKLKTLLRQADSDIPWLHGVIVFTNPHAVLDVEGLGRINAVAVKDLRRIASARIALSNDQLAMINACLSASQK